MNEHFFNITSLVEQTKEVNQLSKAMLDFDSTTFNNLKASDKTTNDALSDSSFTKVQTTHNDVTSPHSNVAATSHNNIPAYSHYNSPGYSHYNSPGSPHGDSPATPHSNSASTPHSNTALTPHSNTAAVPHSNTAAVPHSNSAATPHSDTAASPHSDTPARSHSNSTSPHSDTPARSHSNVPQPHSNFTAYGYVPTHTNVPARHSNSAGYPHSNTAARHSNTAGSPHSNTAARSHSNTAARSHYNNAADPHSNTAARSHSNTAARPHSNTAARPHSNTAATYHYNSPTTYHYNSPATYHYNSAATPHGDTPATPHNNVTPHTYTSFDHTNFIPTQPKLYNLAANDYVKGLFRFGFYSYDRNTKPTGSTDVGSTTVHYKIEMQKTSGSPIVGWTTLKLDVSGNTSSSGTVANDITLDNITINTLDPFALGWTAAQSEGTYQLRITPFNPQKSGADGVVQTYIGTQTTVQFTIRQNTLPELSVTNATGEFVNFTFGETGAKTSGGSYSTYDAINVTHPSDKREGIYVAINMKDVDTSNYQKGVVRIRRPDNVEITSQSITWQNAQQIIQSNNTNVTGFAFIPKSSYLSAGNLNGCKVELEVGDYTDAAGTQAADTVKKVQNYISLGDNTVMVFNIDNVAPTVPTMSVNPIARTNQNVLVTVVYPGDAARKQYKIGNGTWTDYTGPITISTNCTVYAKGIDDVGNESTESSIAIINIDKDAPVAPTMVATPTTPTNGDVSVEISYPEDAQTKQYKIGNGEWTNYVTPITVSTNCTIYAKGIDDVGNESMESSIAIINIDKDAPVAPILSAAPTTPTNGVVTVTITYSSDSNTKQYKIENGVWTNYTGDLTINTNCTVYAKGIDEVGNESTENSIIINNIDKNAPNPPDITASPTTATNGNVFVTITYPLDAQTKLYSTNGTDWQPYIGQITITENCVVHAKAVDNAGNESTENTLSIINIDKTGPIAPNVNVPSGAYNQAKDITVIPAPDAINTYYTRDGSDPDDTSFKVLGAIHIDGPDNETQILKLVSYDALGNKGDIATYMYAFDKFPPEIKVDIKGRGRNTTDINVNVNIIDASIWQYQWTTGNTAGTDWQDEYTMQKVITQSTDGVWYLFIKAIDEAGNSSNAKYGPYIKGQITLIEGYATGTEQGERKYFRYFAGKNKNNQMHIMLVAGNVNGAIMREFSKDDILDPETNRFKDGIFFIDYKGNIKVY